MTFDETAAALIDLEDAAAALGIPPQFALYYLEAHGETPIATYHGQPLWLSDTVHDAIPVDPEQAARAAYESRDRLLRGEAPA